MFELIIAGVFLFGDGSWNCIHKYDYPPQNVRETFVSNVKYSQDLTYIASSKIIYSHLKEKEVFAQFSYNERGVAKVSGNTFHLEGQAYNVVKDFDKIDHFKIGYTEEITTFLNSPISPEEKTLKVISSTNKKMLVKHEKSGTITECEALTNEV